MQESLLLLSSLALFTLSGIPVREWCRPQWVGHPPSINGIKVIREAHLPSDSRWPRCHAATLPHRHAATPPADANHHTCVWETPEPTVKHGLGSLPFSLSVPSSSDLLLAWFHCSQCFTFRLSHRLELPPSDLQKDIFQCSSVYSCPSTWCFPEEREAR